MSVKSDFHVGISKSPRGCFFFPTWGRFDSSEVSFHSSEVSFHSSEEFFIPHVGISKSPRGDHFFPAMVPFRYVVSSKLLRLLQKSTVSQSCKQDCPDFAERMKRKALRVRSEAHIPPYVTEAESRKQHSDSP